MEDEGTILWLALSSKSSNSIVKFVAGLEIQHEIEDESFFTYSILSEMVGGVLKVNYSERLVLLIRELR